MNILFLIGSYEEFGGTEKITTVLANEFAKTKGVHIAAVRGMCQPEKMGLSAAVGCHNLGGLKDSAVLRQILIENKIDVIINQWCLPFYVTRYINKARKGLSVRLISALHGVPDRSKVVIRAEDRVKASRGLGRLVARLRLWAIERVIRASIRYVYRNSDKYVVLSKGFIKSFQDYTGLRNTSKLIAIGNPITLETETGPFAKKKQILSVGRLDKENKRTNRIVEAWEQAANDYPDWELVLVGDGPHRPELEEYVRSRQIPRVTFAGRQGDVRPYYRESSIFMLTSDLEGFGLVLVECMSYGVVPIVYGSYVSVFDIIDNGTSGIITPMPYSQEKTVERMRELMANDNLRRQMALAAKEKAKFFSLASICAQWACVLGTGQRKNAN